MSPLPGLIKQSLPPGVEDLLATRFNGFSSLSLSLLGPDTAEQRGALELCDFQTE